jgi:hypothetical protein
MFLHCLCKNEDVIQVDADYTFRNQVLEYLIHHGLKGGWAVGETKEHNQGFEKSSVCAEGGLPLITFLDADIVVPLPDIEFGEIPRTLELVNEVGDEWE